MNNIINNTNNLIFLKYNQLLIPNFNYIYNSNNNNCINNNSNNNNVNNINNSNNNLPILPYYLQKYILLIICEYINDGSNISFNSFNKGCSFIKDFNVILMNTSLVCKSYFEFISNNLNVYFLENNNSFNYNNLYHLGNNSNNNFNHYNNSRNNLYNNNNINTFVINFNNNLNSQNNTTDEINNMNNNNNGDILINNQTISNYHFIDYINEKIKCFTNLKKIKIISNSGCYYSKLNGVDDLNRIIFLGEIKVYRIVLRSCLMSHSNRNRYQITIAEFIFKPNNNSSGGNNIQFYNNGVNDNNNGNNQLEINQPNENNNDNQDNIQENNNNNNNSTSLQQHNNNIIHKPIHSFKIKKIIHEYSNSMLVKDLNLGLFIYSINKSKEQFVVRESFTSLSYPFEQQQHNNLLFSQQLLSKYYSYFLIMLILTIPFIFYK